MRQVGSYAGDTVFKRFNIFQKVLISQRKNGEAIGNVVVNVGNTGINRNQESEKSDQVGEGGLSIHQNSSAVNEVRISGQIEIIYYGRCFRII